MCWLNENKMLICNSYNWLLVTSSHIFQCIFAMSRCAHVFTRYSSKWQSKPLQPEISTPPPFGTVFIDDNGGDGCSRWDGRKRVAAGIEMEFGEKGEVVVASDGIDAFGYVCFVPLGNFNSSLALCKVEGETFAEESRMLEPSDDAWNESGEVTGRAATPNRNIMNTCETVRSWPLSI